MPYNPELYLPAPAVIEKRYELWSISSWKRKILEELIKEFEKWKEKIPEFELLSLQQKTLMDIYFPQIVPLLPEKQQRAFQIAIENGYYSFPRLNNLKGLAKIMKVTSQTFHEHLRRAEEKLLPLFAQNIK